MKCNSAIRSIIVLFLLVLFFSNQALSQQSDTNALNKSRMRVIIIGGTTLYAGSMIALSQAWYKGQEMTTFHFINDNAEWNQVDKVGHAYTAYQISRLGTSALQWANVPGKKAYIYGSLIGFIYLTQIEILDGFSRSYGASWGDIGANILGNGLWLGQYFLWKDERIHFKYSFHRTSYAKVRPEVLGDGLAHECLKDYNGQTYWLSFDIYSLFWKKKNIPKWLNISIGYGAQAMVSANEPSNNDMGYQSYRQYYIGLDLDLSHFRTKSKILNTLIYLADMIKIPGPTLEYNKQQGWKFHTLYF